PQFKSLLLHHWMEEHQHALLDALMVEAIAEGMSAADINAGIDGYLALGAFIDDALGRQTAFDLAALETASRRMLSESERARFTVLQRQANRWTYIGSGMSHPRFLETLERLNPERRAMIEAAAPAFS